MIRHGESIGNVARELAEANRAEVIDTGGRDPDVPLSELGHEQAHAVGRHLNRVVPQSASVWSSPYRRAITTAQLAMVSADRTVRVRTDERLRDRELGVLDTLTAHGVRTRYPTEAERRQTLGKFYYRPPGGESWTDLALRLRSFLADLGGDTIIFTHDAVITLTRYVCCGLTEREVLDLAAHNPIGNASISRFARHQGGWRVVQYNGQDHLLDGDRDLRTTHPGEPDVHPH
jgi:broad specificity phosphatase PhoE